MRRQAESAMCSRRARLAYHHQNFVISEDVSGLGEGKDEPSTQSSARRFQAVSEARASVAGSDVKLAVAKRQSAQLAVQGERQARP